MLDVQILELYGGFRYSFSFILFILLTWKSGCFLYYDETVAKLMFANLMHFNWPSLLSHCWYKDFSVHSVHISTGHFTFCLYELFTYYSDWVLSLYMLQILSRQAQFVSAFPIRTWSFQGQDYSFLRQYIFSRLLC